MVFGTTYCAVSRLPIEDQDECMVVPLGFSLGGDFDKYNAPDANAFEWLWYFAGPAEKVRYSGNPSHIFAPAGSKNEGELWDKHSMYMLVRLDVWEGIQAEWKGRFETTDDIRLGRTNQKIWDQSVKERGNEMKKLVANKITAPEYDNFKHSAWITEIEKLNLFMCRMGIAPNPMSTVDQDRDAGTRYWKLVDNIRNKK